MDGHVWVGQESKIENFTGGMVKVPSPRTAQLNAECSGDGGFPEFCSSQLKAKGILRIGSLSEAKDFHQDTNCKTRQEGGIIVCRFRTG